MARWAADLAVALLTTWTWVLFAGLNTTSWARLEWWVAFRIERPHVTRALVPGLIAACEAVLPDLSWLMAWPLVDGTVRAFSQEFIQTPPTIAVLAFAASLGFVLLAIRATRRLLAAEAPEVRGELVSVLAWASVLSLLVLMIGRNTFGRPYLALIYDPATLAMTTLCLALMAERRWWFYVAAFLVAAVNRETIAYLIPVFCLFAWRELDRLRFAGLLAAQMAGFVAVRGALTLAFSHLPERVVGVSLIMRDAAEFVPVGWEIPVIASVVATLIAGRLLASGLSLFSLAIAPSAFMGYMLVGEPGEYRVFLEVVPVLALSSAVVLQWSLSHVEERAHPSPRHAPSPPIEASRGRTLESRHA